MADFNTWMFGENPSDVVLPGAEQAKRRREMLMKAMEAEAMGKTATAGERAIQLAGRQAAEDAARRQQAMAAGARGFGRLAAQQAAMQGAALAEQNIAATTAAQAGQARAQEAQAARSGLAQLSEQDRQIALQEEELRKQRAKKGFAPLLGTGLGAGLGALVGLGFGAPGAGAKLGGQLGGLGGSMAAEAMRG